MAKIFIDGSEGTTGLRIRERMAGRTDVEMIVLPEKLRKDAAARKEALNQADIAFLCLPDEASVEAVAMVENPDTVIIDTSTAHRTNPAWVYGFPELKGQREKIRVSKRIANPGCHSSGAIALVRPLVQAGLLDSSALLSIFSLTGYSGGGKSMIAEYEAETRDPLYEAPRMYAITQMHKHLPEIKNMCGLATTPVLCPIVAPFYSGMEVTIPLFAENVKGSVKDIAEIYSDSYQRGLVRFVPKADENGFLSAGILSKKDNMQLTIAGNEERILLVARFDNLGKGASGAAIQNMNLVLGIEETTGLTL